MVMIPTQSWHKVSAAVVVLAPVAVLQAALSPSVVQRVPVATLVL